MSMTHDEIIEVVQAHRDGAEIECSYINRTEEKWGTASPVWNFEHFKYRIKPKPREPRVIWVNEYPQGFGRSGIYHQEEDAASMAASSAIAARKFIEVIEE